MVTRRVTAAAWCLWFPRCLPAPCRSGRTGKAQAARHAAHAQPPARARPCANAQGAAEGGQRAWTRASCRCVSTGRRASAATSHPATPTHQPSRSGLGLGMQGSGRTVASEVVTNAAWPPQAATAGCSQVKSRPVSQ